MPDAAFVQFKYLDYRDWQPGADRMSVRSPSFYALKPLSDSLVVEGSLVYDGMSGASPLYFNTLSGASGQGVHDSRAAGDVKLTRYFDGYSVGAGALYSHENDYISRAGTLELRTWTADRNRTWAFSFSGAVDRIDAEEGAAQDERKYALDFLVGVTQAVNPTLIVQSNLTYSRAPRLPQRPVQAARQPARRAAHLRVAHAREPVLSRGERRAAGRLPLPRRFLGRRLPDGRGLVGAGAAAGLERDAGRALPHAGRGVVLLRAADRQRLPSGPALHRRQPALRVRRDHAGRGRRQDLRRRLGRRPAGGLLSPEGRRGSSAAAAPRACWTSRRGGCRSGWASRSDARRAERSPQRGRAGRSMGASGPADIPVRFRFPFRAMAAEHELLVDHDDGDLARRAAEAAIADVQRIEAKYSRYRDDSVTSAIARAAGGAPVAIDAETAALLDYADTCFALSGGAFDITSGVLRRAWDFRRQPPRLPTPEDVAALLPLIGWSQGGAHGDDACACRCRACSSTSAASARSTPRTGPPACSRPTASPTRWSTSAAIFAPSARSATGGPGASGSALRGRCRADRRRSRRSTSRTRRSRPRATTSASSRSTACATRISSTRAPAGRSATGNRCRWWRRSRSSPAASRRSPCSRGRRRPASSTVTASRGWGSTATAALRGTLERKAPGG